MIPLITAVFFASLLGSLHCVGMCGAFMGVVLGDTAGKAAHVGYHGGRLLTYVTLGALAGVLGKGLDIAGAMAGLQPIALVLSAAAIMTMGILTWLRLRGMKVGRMHGPKWIHRIASAGYRVAMKRPPVQRALIVGLLTTLMPCGWLWTFLLTAAGTARPGTAALTMFIFWLGTLPAMAVLGVGLRGMLGAAQRRLPTFTCLAMTAVGLFTLIGRAHMSPQAWTAPPAKMEKVAAVIAAEPPCCKEPDAH